MASIRKRGSNSYLIVVSRGYDYEGNRLKSVQKTVKPPKEYTPKQAEKWVKEQAILFEREVQHTPEPINRSITLAKYIEHWVTDVGPKKLADSTFRRDEQDIRRILPALGNYKLTDLRKEVIRDFYEEMRHSPRLDGRGNLSEKSVEGLHNTLCGILSAAVDEGYLTHNPAWRCYKPKGQKKERPVADEETVKKLITAFEGQSMKYETYFKLVLATGLRRGEACGLRWSDINWRKRTIHVQRGVVMSQTADILLTGRDMDDRTLHLREENCIWTLEDEETAEEREIKAVPDYLWKAAEYIESIGNWQGTASELLAAAGIENAKPNQFTYNMAKYFDKVFEPKNIRYKTHRKNKVRLLSFYGDDGDGGDDDIDITQLSGWGIPERPSPSSPSSLGALEGSKHGRSVATGQPAEKPTGTAPNPCEAASA